MAAESLFSQVFSIKKPVIAMLHIFDDDIQAQIDQALEDLECLQLFVEGVIVENYGFGYSNLNPNLAVGGIVETLIRIIDAVIRESTIPVGLNILPNDYEKALRVASITGAEFIQLDHVTGRFLRCYPVDPHELTIARNKYPEVALLGGIHPKYYTLTDSTTSISESANEAKLLADAVVVTGNRTGGQADLDDIKSAKDAIGSHPLIIGSGVDPDNVCEQLSIADGAIVGTAFKREGVNFGNPIDVSLVEIFMNEVKRSR
ncbi:BtpA/SgcQ family protein [Patescibacteria group bacterium]